MTKLMQIICDEISLKGPISIARYMELALHHPQYGYYTNRNPLGADGDFVTAPETSQMFGELIGVWCFEIWKSMGRPNPFILLELGPGRGTMLLDMLRAMEKITEFQQAKRLYLVECNKVLREIQKEKLGAHNPIFIESIDKLSESLPAMPMIIVANEFFDNMPLHQFIKTEKGWRERLVGCSNGKLFFTEGEIKPDLAETISSVTADSFSLLESNVVRDPRLRASDQAVGMIYEVSPVSLTLVMNLSSMLVKNKGALLLVDYGYTVLSGESSLQSLKGHEFIDPLDYPGEADITADVDFSALRYMAEHCGAQVIGPVGQGEFLRAMGIELRAAQLMKHAPEAMLESIQADLQRLVDSDYMGVKFKAMAVVSPAVNEVPGFP